MPNWVKIAVVAPLDKTGRICEVFDALDALSVTVENSGPELDFDEFQPNPPKWPIQSVSGLFDETRDRESIINTLRQIAGAEATISSDKVADRDWVSESQKAIQALQIADNLWICPTWCAPPTTNGQVIWITPGLAFGTGHHPSTALCLEKLASLSLRNTVVLDWGSGSGILAIAAIMLGASKALAVDIDNHALTATSNNAKKNGVDDRLVVSRPEELPKNFQCQLVVANLLAFTLINLSKTFERYLADGGKLLLSGILEDQAANVISAFGQRYSFEPLTRDGWTMITATCKQASKAP